MIRLAWAALGSLALIGCGEEASEPLSETDAGAGAAPQVVATAGPMAPGLYAFERSDRVYSRTRLHADGSYTDYDGGDNAVGSGQWSNRDGQICFDPAGDGENEQESCWINDPPGPDGSFLTRLVGGDTRYVVRPIGE